MAAKMRGQLNLCTIKKKILVISLDVKLFWKNLPGPLNYIDIFIPIDKWAMILSI